MDLSPPQDIEGRSFLFGDRVVGWNRGRVWLSGRFIPPFIDEETGTTATFHVDIVFSVQQFGVVLPRRAQEEEVRLYTT